MFGYENFNEIDDPKLRAWNRYNIAINILERYGRVVYTDYMNQFPREDIIVIARVAVDSFIDGYENTRRNFIRERNEVNDEA